MTGRCFPVGEVTVNYFSSPQAQKGQFYFLLFLNESFSVGFLKCKQPRKSNFSDEEFISLLVMIHTYSYCEMKPNDNNRHTISG